nr:unnamed protein product [Callosobruchus chinensis]
MRGKKMVEMCTNHTYVRLQDADVVSEESSLNFDSLINQAEIVFDDELSNLGLTPNGNLRSDLPDTSRRRKKRKNIGATCSSEVCKKSSKRRCHEITEASRREIFKAFWNDLDWEQRKVYVSNLVSKREKMRATKSDNDSSRRSSSLFYNLNIDGQIVHVCKNMFLKTLAVKEWSVRNCNTHTDRRFSSRATQNDKVISTFLGKLPKIPSHYCRKDTKKMYLEQDLSNYSDLYKAYIEYSNEENTSPASRNTH